MDGKPSFSFPPNNECIHAWRTSQAMSSSVLDAVEAVSGEPGDGLGLCAS